MRFYKFTLSCIILCLSTLSGVSQNALILKEKIGNKYYGNMAYMQAIATYEDVLKEDSSNFRVLSNLAYAYRKIYDMDNAERVFAKLVSVDANNAEYVLEFAKLLAIQKKYSESAKFYAMHAQLKPQDARSKSFVNSYENETVLFNNDERLKLELMNFNSGQSDFSPAYYQKGLVFVSNRNYHKVIKRVFEWDQSSFLDLYHIKDTSYIKKVKADTAAGKSKRREIFYNDDDTRFTSNDTRTMGVIGYKYVDTTNMFVTADVPVQLFSKKIKSKYHEGPVTFSADQKTIIFTRNNYYNGRVRKSDEGVNKLKLFSATINDSAWTNIEPLPFNNNNYSVGHPTFGLGDTILYFASDMPGVVGGSDIYKSYYRNKEWSTPENLGRPINTEGNELFPYIDKEGTLYFSSDGHPGLGGLDIFTNSLKDTIVRNMGIPLNSNYDDFGIALDETTVNGFISSNRRRGVNDDDIYKISLQKTSPFNILVVDSVTNRLIGNATATVSDLSEGKKVTIESLNTGKFIAKLWNQNQYNILGAAQDYFSSSIITIADFANPTIIVKLKKQAVGCVIAGIIVDKDTKQPLDGARLTITKRGTNDTFYDYVVGKDGAYSFSQLPGGFTYDINISKIGYFKKPALKMSKVSDPCKSGIPELKDFELEKIIIGKAIKIDNIYFDLAKYNIRPSAAKELDKIVNLMVENPDIIIELSSHTDCRASYQYNTTLSDNRAKSSAQYIISKGISMERVTGLGYGETKLVNDCACEGKIVSRTCTEEEHQANRRTEFQVTGFLSDKTTTILNDGKGTTPQSVPLPDNK